MLLPVILLFAAPAQPHDDLDAPAPSSEPAAGAFSLDTVGAEQVVQVTTREWHSDVARLTRFEKVGGVWMQVGAAIEVVVGENGLGWGLGLHPLGVGEPRKVEGDGRAPAGVFRLLSAFGPIAPPVKTRLPWLRTADGLVCVDDPRGGAYNRLVDENATPTVPEPDGGVAAPVQRSYRSAEPMWRDDGLYELGLLVDQNGFGDTTALVVPGRGSCTFLHIWKRKGRATQGCTAMARADLEKLVEWLDPEKKPVLVQLPLPEMVKRRIPWRLP